MASSLDPLFHPRSVAVIGASRSHGAIGGDLFHNLLSREFAGPVYPVNRSATEVQSVRAYKSVLDVPDEVDLAVIAVPKPAVLEAVLECGRKGVKVAVVISAGLAEVGPAGAATQQEILQAARRMGMRLVGPNCLGVLNTDPSVRLDATFGDGWPPAGGVSFASQSGALGLAMLEYARDLGVGIRHFVSVGNKADVSGNDLLEYWERDDATRVILLYLESFGNPRRFLEIARRVSAAKPIVVVKGGRSEAGARAASSHTGALATREVAIDALLTQAGVIRTSTLEELFGVAQLLANQPVVRGPRIGLVTNAGGPAILAADACEARGLTLPPLGESTVRALREILPPDASLRNPVDMIAGASAESYDSVLPMVMADRSVDAVMALFIPTGAADAVEVARTLARTASWATKPLVACFMGTANIDKARALLHEAKIPCYAFPESGAGALASAASYGVWRARHAAFAEHPVSLPKRIPLELGGTGGDGTATRWLTSTEVAALLDACGLHAPATILAASERAACEAATKIGFPVAVKVASDTITHKTDVGGVHLALQDVSAVRAAWRAIESRLDELGRRHEMAGVLVQAMAPRGVETLVGVTRDPTVGPLIAFGLGGTYAEIMRDVVFRVVPIAPLDAEDMVQGIRGARLLDGYRSSPPADRAALADALVRVSQLVLDQPEIVELDINPLVALPPGRGVVAVDARVLVRA